MRYKVNNPEFQELLCLRTELRASVIKRGRWYSNSSDRGQYQRTVRYCGKVNLCIKGLFYIGNIEKSPLYQFHKQLSNTPVLDEVKSFIWRTQI